MWQEWKTTQGHVQLVSVLKDHARSQPRVSPRCHLSHLSGVVLRMTLSVRVHRSRSVCDERKMSEAQEHSAVSRSYTGDALVKTPSDVCVRYSGKTNTNTLHIYIKIIE